MLRVDQLRSWFSTFKAKRTKNKAVEDPREAFWRCHTVPMLERELKVSGKPKEELVKLVLAKEGVSGAAKGFINGAYYS